MWHVIHAAVAFTLDIPDTVIDITKVTVTHSGSGPGRLPRGRPQRIMVATKIQSEATQAGSQTENSYKYQNHR